MVFGAVASGVCGASAFFVLFGVVFAVGVGCEVGAVGCGASAHGCALDVFVGCVLGVFLWVAQHTLSVCFNWGFVKWFCGAFGLFGL